MIDKKTMGKKSRQSGKRFELEVRKDLEAKGFIVCKWTNTVDLENNKLVQAKSKYNPFLKRVMSEGSGWPDFLIYNCNSCIIGVEAKKAKYLDAKEKQMAQWLLQHRIFNEIQVAFPEKNKMKDKRKIGISYNIVQKEEAKRDEDDSTKDKEPFHQV
ncbi:hypothetical protein M0R04_08745 [Candidatus Dojkabacteria bacterium]|jgi:hypothetical protein|nr:hypothetical protein [Candidatus Dojkabacteria bacterium]